MKWRLPAWIREPIRAKLRDLLGELILKNYLVFGEDKSRLKIADTAIVANAFFNVCGGEIILEEHVLFAHYVCVTTGSHDYSKFGFDRIWTVAKSGRDILIKRGAWIGSNVTILGPCIIGEHAVVAAGALVNQDVPPYTIVAGVPARIIKTIAVEEHHSTQIEKTDLHETAPNSL